ncbi:hypothetical protein ACOSQ4_032896 [Xanthoceras sorbifolium]
MMLVGRRQSELALALQNLELPIQARLRINGGRVSKFIIKDCEVLFRAFVGILQGDITTLTCVLAEIISR